MIEIISNSGNTVAEMELKNEQLDGTCKWFDSSGRCVANGVFKNGQAFDGTFINWQRFFPSEDAPFDAAYYCQDHVTLFEMSYDSENPDYTSLIEVYSEGTRQPG